MTGLKRLVVCLLVLLGGAISANNYLIWKRIQENRTRIQQLEARVEVLETFLTRLVEDLLTRPGRYRGKTATMDDELRQQIHRMLTTPPSGAAPNPHRRRLTGGTGHKWWSEALGVPPGQIQEARDELRRHGISAEFDSQGRVRVESQKQVRDIARATGIYSGRDGYEAGGLSGRRPAQEFQRSKEALRRACES